VLEVLEMERERCRAISERIGRSSPGSSDDLTHPCDRGDQDKDSHLEHGKKAGRTERRDLVVRLYRDAAVVTGPQILVERDGEVSEVVVASLQVWTRADGS
jgi:hypothetical protein